MAIEQNILLSTDIILIGPQGRILLVQRKNPPFQGDWAFPGGFLEGWEDLPDGAVRELKEETGLAIEPERLRQYKTVGTPDRDPRGRTVTVVYHGEVDVLHKVKGEDDAADAQWFPLDKLPTMAFDHGEILREFLYDMQKLTKTD